MTTALLVPCYNAVRFLPRLREQVDRLSPGFDEVLLADDASQDETVGQARRLGFTIIELPKNLGPGGARNALARATTAEWIHFHDVDDELAPDYLANVLPAAVGGCEAVLHYVDFIDETTRGLIMRWKFDPEALIRDSETTLLRGPMPTMSSLLRRSSFLSAGGFHEQRRCFEDGDFHFRIALLGMRIRAVPKVLEWSLRHGDGAGANQHYCFKCRLGFLEDYAVGCPVRLQAAIAEEAERAAVMLLRFGDRAGGRQAIALARRLGRRIPNSGNPLFKMARLVLPASTLLHWQDSWRNKKDHRHAHNH